VVMAHNIRLTQQIACEVGAPILSYVMNKTCVFRYGIFSDSEN
jgi:hypothetical protein